MSPSDLELQQDRLNDKYVEASYSYWNALLTVNGLILAFFSSDLFLGRVNYGLLVYILVFCCVISISLVLWNHKSIREFYFDLAGLTPEGFRELTDEKREEMREDDQKRFENSKKREIALEVLMFTEAVILFLIVVAK